VSRSKVTVVAGIGALATDGKPVVFNQRAYPVPFELTVKLKSSSSGLSDLQQKLI
jgi:hypothetical protein